MNAINLLRIALSLALFLNLCTPVWADQYHYINMLIGDRASGMGGAYTAVSDDAAGLYYNPAGIVFSSGRNVSASVNTFYQQTKKYQDVIGGNGWTRKATAVLPNYFGVIQSAGKLKVGFSYAVPDSTREDQDQSFANVPSKFPGITATQYVINYNNDDNTYLIGPSAALEVTRDVAVGMTLYYHQRSQQLILNQLITLSNGKYELSNLYAELSELGVRPVIGVMWSPFEKFAFGLSVAKTVLLRSNLTVQREFKDTNYDGNTIDHTVESFTAKKKYPVQTRAGVAYFATPSLLLTADLHYTPKTTDPVYEDRVSVVNGAVGLEYYLDRSWALRAGLYTDMANTPEIQQDRQNQLENIDLYGASLSISHFTRNTSVTLGTNVTMGSGRAQIVGDSTEIQDVDVAGWMVFLSSSYSY